MSAGRTASSVAGSRCTLVQPRAPQAPLKDCRLGPHEFPLLVWSQFDHAPGLVGTERGEDLAAHPEVRMVHVRFLDGLGKTERQGPEFLRGHFSLRMNSNY
jgi:hypothetical protein